MKLELMAPAGNPLSFLAALENHADSVYLGLKYFNARRPAKNFTIAELKKAVEFAHKKNVKVYLTLNIDIKSNEIKQVSQILLFCSQINIDAVIVKDFAIISLVNKYFQNINIHISTQCAISSNFGVKYSQEIGVQRVVLARELELSEIKEICDNSNIEIEIFTEGSMCFSVSGRCLMSSWVGGKSGNRGACTAPCRVLWNSNGEKFNFFSMKDLRLLFHLKELNKLGIASIKIEGRLKKAEWVAEIVRLYREMIDSIYNEDKSSKINIDRLLKFSAREVDTGHLFAHKNLIGENQEWQNYSNKEKINIIENPFIMDNEILFIFITDGVEIKIKIDDETAMIKEKLKTKSKKAKLVSFNRLITEINSENILNLKFIVKTQGEIANISSSALQKIKQNIIKQIQSLIKKQESLPELDKNISNFIQFNNLTKERKKLLGSLPNKAIINSQQILLLLSNNFAFDEIVVEIGLDIDIGKLNLLKEKYKVVLSLPKILYNKEAIRVFELVNKLQIDFTEMEANSFTGMQMLNELSVKKRAGIGLNILNHIAADYLYEDGYHSVYTSVEGDIKDYRFLSKTCKKGIDALVFGKLPLFVSRVDSNNFRESQIFKDKFGVNLECKKGLGVNYFISTKPFSLIGENIRGEEIFFDNLTIDLRFFKNPIKIYKSLLDNSQIDTGSFNFYRKLY